MRGYRAISLFSGAGGMDIGVKDAGFGILAEIEIDKYCCQTLRAGVEREKGSTAVFEADIREVNPEDLMKKLKLKPKELELLFGGPPCQPFSLAGKQKSMDDARGPLLFEILRFADTLKPKVIFVEQVKGLLSAKGEKGRKGEVFELFIGELEKINYTPKWQICCAADYGVPQIRERVIIIATYGKNGFIFPEHSHAPKEQANCLFNMEPYKTVGEALSGLGKPADKIKGTTFYNRVDSHVDVTPMRDKERIANVPEGTYLASQTHLSKDVLCGLQPKDTTKYLRLSRGRPSNTLRCGEIFYHPTENRYLTPREYMRLHGYRDDYILLGPIRSRTGTVKNLDQHRQVANSVPPPLAYAIANKIRSFLDE
ncbi:MAG: DNA cytosine methyltransferase [Chitinispirillales bacterium]|jgi:DNA (cytosine-5)-methyltransferase 1|nr:DNA cytosine methyltransferase [Chitinispirillales bacterium]